jgi:hypothetical protein
VTFSVPYSLPGGGVPQFLFHHHLSQKFLVVLIGAICYAKLQRSFAEPKLDPKQAKGEERDPIPCKGRCCCAVCAHGFLTPTTNKGKGGKEIVQG